MTVSIPVRSDRPPHTRAASLGIPTSFSITNLFKPRPSSATFPTAPPSPVKSRPRAPSMNGFFRTKTISMSSQDKPDLSKPLPDYDYELNDSEGQDEMKSEKELPDEVPLKDWDSVLGVLEQLVDDIPIRHKDQSDNLSQIWGEFSDITGTGTGSESSSLHSIKKSSKSPTSPIRREISNRIPLSPLQISIHPGSPSCSTYTRPSSNTSSPIKTGLDSAGTSASDHSTSMAHSSSMFSLSSFPSPPLSKGEFSGSTVSILPPRRLDSLASRREKIVGTRPLSSWSVDEEEELVQQQSSPRKAGLIGLNLFEIREEPVILSPILDDVYHPVFSPHSHSRNNMTSPSFPSNSSTFSVDVSSPTPSYPSTSSQPSSLFTVSIGSTCSSVMTSNFDQEASQLCYSDSSSLKSNFLLDRSPLFGLEFDDTETSEEELEEEGGDETIQLEPKNDARKESTMVEEVGQIEYGWAI